MKMKKNSFVEGTLIASSAIIITKILGVLYVVPFYAIVGEQGGVLYAYAYNIYHLFLNISTAGIPLAISMIVAEYSALGMIDAKERSYSIGKKILLVVSISAFIILFFFSNIFAKYYIGGIEGANAIGDVSLVIKVMSFCLLIMPFLSILRGYLQGHKIIAPSSTSQVVEQMVRVIVIVLGSYLAINVFNTTIPVGVAFALSGTFIGGLFAYLYLRFKVNKNKELFEKSIKKDDIKDKVIAKKIVTYALPIILAAIIANLYDFIDIKLIIYGLYSIGYAASDAELISSIICTWGLKICMIVVAIGIGLNTSLLPHMVTYFTNKEFEKTNKIFNQAISTILVSTVPMAVGISLLSSKIYYLFYGQSYYGPLILAYLAIEIIFIVCLLVLNTSLQSMKKFKLIYFNSIVGLGVNAILDIPLIMLFNKIGIHPFYGTITATMVGCSISFIIIFAFLKKDLGFKYKPILHNIKKLVMPTFSMILILIALNRLLPLSDNKFVTLGYVTIEIICGAFVYLFLTYKNGVLSKIFGNDLVNKVFRKLHIIK